MSRFPKRPQLAFRPLKEQRSLQAALLRRHLAYCARSSPYYRRVFQTAGIRPGAIGLDDLAALPFTDKADLAQHNDEFLAVPPDRVVDLALSSGTTGKPNRMMYSERDLQRLAYNEELSFSACAINARDTALLTCTMDRCFIAGLAYYLGIRALGATAIRNGHGSLASHVEIIQTIKPTVVVGVPSFLRRLALYAQEQGLAPRRSSVRKLVCIGEPVRGADLRPLKLGRDLQKLWNADVFSTYASSECVTTFCECPARQGGHLHPDLAIIEVVDEAGRPVPPGQPGEVVLTPLAVEAMPLVRFKTGDISFLIEGACACGRRSPRLGPILGRKQQMLKLRGTTLYPPAVFAALDEIPQVGECYLELLPHAELSDELVIHLGLRAPLPLPQLREALQARLRVTPTIRVEPEEHIRQQIYTEASRKPLRVIDRRAAT